MNSGDVVYCDHLVLTCRLGIIRWLIKLIVVSTIHYHRTFIVWDRTIWGYFSGHYGVT